MKIHTVKSGESLSDIGKNYGTFGDMIRRDNGLDSDTLTEGEQLLILTPTRTYLPRKNDSTEGISHRFGIKESELAAANPCIMKDGLKEELLALRCAPARYGSAAANGYYYRGCPTDKLKEALPYLTYITFASGYCDSSGIKMLFDTREAMEIINDTGIIPLLKFFDKREGKSLEESEKLAEEIIRTAKDSGFSGIVIELSSPERTEGSILAFLTELKRKMIGSDLILIAETDENTPMSVGDLCDGCTHYLPFTAGDFNTEISSRAEKYAKESESAKAFLELPLFSTAGKDYIPTSDAIARARRCGAKLSYNESEKTLSFTHKKHGEIKIPSLEYIKELLELVNKYNYMGISFDIGRVPLPYLMMYNSLYKTVKGTRERAAEGCSRRGR